MTEKSSSTLVELRAELMSIVTKADGKVKDVENITAETIIDCSGTINETFAKELYHWSIKTSLQTEEKQDLYSQLHSLSLAEKVNIIRALWAVAIADGEIHPSEKEEIQSMMAAMGVDETMLSKYQG